MQPALGLGLARPAPSPAVLAGAYRPGARPAADRRVPAVGQRVAGEVVALLVRGQIAYKVPPLVTTLGSTWIGGIPWIVIVAAAMLAVTAPTLVGWLGPTGPDAAAVAAGLLATLLVLGAALLMQVITNMQNDVGYTVRGGDSSGTRTGLPRATANGWLSVRHVRAGIVLAALAAFLFWNPAWPSG